MGKKYGRLANRLWIFSYFAANAIEHGHKLIYRNFDEYIPKFESTRKNDFAGYPIKTRLSRWIILDYLLFLLIQAWIEIIKNRWPKGRKYQVLKLREKNKVFDLNQEKFLEPAKNSLIIVRDGGLFYRDDEHLMKHSHLIRQFFKPLPKNQQAIDQLISSVKAQNLVLVGVHIRKYDYRRFAGGKFFFDDHIYLQNMRLLEQKLKKENQQVRFLICSDEKIDVHFFKELDVVTGTGKFIEDLYTLARCDYLIGAPSSFTMWASFYGQVPLSFLEPETKRVNLEKFIITNSIDHLFKYHKIK
ncbi:MAG: alpha-1,2-fucosyltransferase [Candidatus Cyclobacteriaceae bacterium M3_2C_046]